MVAASSLVIGSLLGLAQEWPDRLIGLVLAFGAGALISAVSFELFENGIAVIPEATSKSGRVAGLATTLGFALAAGLSTASA